MLYFLIVCVHFSWDAIDKLDAIVDDSDPDTTMCQTIHAYQTGEALRLNPENADKDYLPLIGFIHDLGKVMMFIEGGETLPQVRYCTTKQQGYTNTRTDI